MQKLPFQNLIGYITLILSLSVLSACGGGSGGGSDYDSWGGRQTGTNIETNSLISGDLIELDEQGVINPVSDYTLCDSFGNCTLTDKIGHFELSAIAIENQVVLVGEEGQTLTLQSSARGSIEVTLGLVKNSQGVDDLVLIDDHNSSKPNGESSTSLPSDPAAPTDTVGDTKKPAKDKKDNDGSDGSNSAPNGNDAMILPDGMEAQPAVNGTTENSKFDDEESGTSQEEPPPAPYKDGSSSNASDPIALPSYNTPGGAQSSQGTGAGAGDPSHGGSSEHGDQHGATHGGSSR